MASSVDLGKHLEDYVDALVNAGRYETRDEVFKEGIRLLEIKERREELEAALARGLAQAEAGLGTPVEEVAARLKQKYSALAKDHDW